MGKIIHQIININTLGFFPFLSLVCPHLLFYIRRNFPKIRPLLYLLPLLFYLMWSCCVRLQLQSINFKCTSILIITLGIEVNSDIRNRKCIRTCIFPIKKTNSTTPKLVMQIAKTFSQISVLVWRFWPKALQRVQSIRFIWNDIHKRIKSLSYAKESAVFSKGEYVILCSLKTIPE